MKAILKWVNDMKLTAVSDGQMINMDAKAPIGGSSAQTPKELILDGLGGCTAMDVIAFLKKHKQPLESLEIVVDVEKTKTGYPVTFTHAWITFKAIGDITPSLLLEAVHLSQTKYCGVSAMLSKAFPIEYTVILNEQELGRGKADFA